MLLEAVAPAHRAGATLVIAEIDRLVRSMAVTAYLKTSRVKFPACDNRTPTSRRALAPGPWP